MKILIVDDSKVTRGIIKRIMSKKEVELFEAENGQEALELLYEHGFFDVIMLDWNMPIMDGHTFLKELRKNPDWDDIKVMMITTENEQKAILEALNAGADEYLMKPFNEEMLLAKMDMLIEESAI